MKIISISVLFLLSCMASSEKKEKPISYVITLNEVCSELEAPIGIVNSQDGSNRLFVIEQSGKVRIIKDGALLPIPLIDITTKIDKLNGLYSEKGLLGLAFHPQFKTNGKFYLYYSAPASLKGMDNTTVISEFTVTPGADVTNKTEKVILKIDEPESNHNGGQMAFGKDGYLYIGVGDGGGGGDKHGTTGNGQNLNSLLGKILRIDISGVTAYASPADNPFVNKDGRDEIYCYGMRNPWRFSFDRKTGELFCADVGQNEYEEVDIIEKGKNYGWRIMEGRHCYSPADNCNMIGLTMPVDEFNHEIGKCVIGGYVYRGTKYPDMQGKYIFGDWTGVFFMLLQPAGSTAWERRALTVANPIGNFYINSFGEDEAGEIYVCGQTAIGPSKSGKLYRITFL